ncbi:MULTISPECIES: adenine glycosylase [unclassified Microbacterium]|uniref:adenine glycosylase n=1 Tax=unclassified Microbacterium TaxID=2609290 RepID=UPI000CFAD120|nr:MULTISPECIES: adenine glycosylase [unclassified Microbacterium]PQZ61320.1 adenine glycosylase [Microbacterium sp. MYb43]PQZ82531.1 adenine glycosylase [Microbacterium sp. MYb40]PRB23769.1 adenine glycosylase [Microbacterium sp. MYb54]PRB29664.1 adenine glycosylase [Microbacterium sp. MYb50]PRB70978.1 adenine glycosylase [Microbacterium sp. MYb24]
MPDSQALSDITSRLSKWYRATARDLPWRRSAFHNEFGAWGVLVSEFMLQQTPVMRVIPHLDAWLDRWPTPAAMATATTAEVVQQWANLGYPRRALWLHRAAVEITDRHGGVVPRDVDALLALSGIGEYTARAVAVFAYGDRHPVVDTNTRRVLARAVTGRSQPGPPSRRDLDLMASLLPDDEEEAAAFNAAAMELGATVCTSRAPRCEVCPLAGSCAWLGAGKPDTGDERRRQATYEGSDRQARGAVLRLLRSASPSAVPLVAVLPDWPDARQRDRAIDSLIADGLAEADGEALSLPR